MMARPARIALGLASLAFAGGLLAVAGFDRPGRLTPTTSTAIWIGQSPDNDRAVNASAGAKAPDPWQGIDTAKAQMASSPASDGPLSIVPPTFAPKASGEPAAQADLRRAPAADHSIVMPEPARSDSVRSNEPPATMTPPAPPSAEVAQLITPVSPSVVSPPVVRPVVPATPMAPTQPAQMTRPPLDTSNSTPGTSTVQSVQPNAANSLSGGAVFTGTSGRDLNIEINRGALIRLSGPADTVFVANPDVADIQVKSARMVYVYGKKAGETVLYAVDSNDNVLLNSRVKVSHNLAAFRAALRSAAPNSGVQVSTDGDALVINGDVGSAVQAENVRRLATRFAPGEGAVVNNMRVTAPNQINLRVRIAEVSRETLKELGINWDSIFQAGGFVFGLATGSPVLAAGSVLTRNNATNSIFGSYAGKNFDINGLIDALATENLISVLAEPNLTAMSGETANFLAGGEFPVPVAQEDGVITIEFKKFGVGLAFTPTVLEGGRVNLKVRPEVSQLSTVGGVSQNGFAVPGLTTRRAETTVELGSGQSFAIAGLLQNNSTQDVNKVPFLGDVPILGALFKSDRYRRNETELVIVVTPYLVRPVSSNVVAAPTDGFVPPTDGQRILFGSTHQQGMPQGARVTRGPDGNALVGPAGFQLD